MPAYAGISSSVEKAETDKQRVVHFLHHVLGQFSYFFFQSGFVDGADLFEQHHAVLGQAIFVAGQLYVGGELCFCQPRRGCRGDYGRAVFVANIVLLNQNGANAALFAAHHGA